MLVLAQYLVICQSAHCLLMKNHFQEIIRASVNQETSTSPQKATIPLPEIKLPGGRKPDRDFLPSATKSTTSNANSTGESEEDDDDWDTFQSFSVAGPDSKDFNTGEESDQSDDENEDLQTNIEVSAPDTDELDQGHELSESNSRQVK